MLSMGTGTVLADLGSMAKLRVVYSEYFVAFCLVANVHCFTQLALCLLLGRLPESPMSPQILTVIDNVLRLFHEVAPRCDTAARSLVSLPTHDSCAYTDTPCSIPSSHA